MKVHLCDVCETRLPSYGHSVIQVCNVVHAPALSNYGKGRSLDLCEACAAAVGAVLQARQRREGSR